MASKRNILGKNLSALLGNTTYTQTKIHTNITTTNGTHNKQIHMVVPSVNLRPSPYQPRINIDEEALSQLAASIKQQGLLQPLIVRALSDQNYEIIAGERRWRACQQAGITNIPVLVHDVDNETARTIALIENLQRENLNAIDEARAIQQLIIECSMTHQQVAQVLSKSRSSITNSLRLLNLDPEVLQYLEQNLIDMGHARALLLLEASAQRELAQQIIAKNLSVRDVEKLVQKSKKPKIVSSNLIENSVNIFKNDFYQIEKRFNLKIDLKPSRSGAGKIIINYSQTETLKSFLDFINTSEPA